MGQRAMSTLTFTHKAVRETMPRELPGPPNSFTAWVSQVLMSDTLQAVPLCYFQLANAGIVVR